MAESREDSSPVSIIETEDGNESRTTDCMIIELNMSGEEDNMGRTRDFLKVIDRGTHNPVSCSTLYCKKDHEIMSAAESWGSLGSISNEEDLITRDFLKLIDDISNSADEEDLITRDFLKLIDDISNSAEEDRETLKMGESVENLDVRTKDYLELIDVRRNEGEDLDRTKMAKSGENSGGESEENDARTKDYLKLIDRSGGKM